MRRILENKWNKRLTIVLSLMLLLSGVVAADDHTTGGSNPLDPLES